MWLFDAFRNQWTDIIRWENPNPEQLIHKFPQALDQIENKSSLIVDPGLAAIFIRNGKIEAVETEGGKWTLETGNTPFISALKNVMSGFETHDKAQVYFVKTHQITNQKWGTPNSVTYIDPVYSFPVELRAFGNFSFKISDVENFWINYVANQANVSIDDVRMLIVDRCIGKIGQILAAKKISYNEIDAHMHDIASELMEATKIEFTALGLQLTDFRIEDVNFTDKTEDFISKVTDTSADVAAINVTKNIDRSAMGNYSQLEQLDIAKTAANAGGSAGDMMGAGLGMAMGMNMADTMSQKNSQRPLNEETPSVEARLEKLKELHTKWLITEDEYSQKKSLLIQEL